MAQVCTGHISKDLMTLAEAEARLQDLDLSDIVKKALEVYLAEQEEIRCD